MIFTVLGGLFVTAFLSATLLPGSSEIALAGVIASGKSSLVLAITVATIGNTLGSCVNWAMGWYAAKYRHSKWFPIKPDRFDAYLATYQKWGLWTLLLSWVPIIGDPLTAIAGFLRTPLWVFVPIVLLAKCARYMIVAGLFTWFW